MPGPFGSKPSGIRAVFFSSIKSSLLIRQRTETRRFAPGRRQGKVSKDKRSVLLPISWSEPQPERDRAADSFPERTIRRRSVPFYRQISDSVAITGSGNFFHNHTLSWVTPPRKFAAGFLHREPGDRNGVPTTQAPRSEEHAAAPESPRIPKPASAPLPPVPSSIPSKH